jgi:hypothetical protein
LGKSSTGRESLLLENGSGRTLIRDTEWVMIPSYPGEPLYKAVNIETGFSPEVQLYYLKNDPGQKKNLAPGEKDRVDKMEAERLLQKEKQAQK